MQATMTRPGIRSLSALVAAAMLSLAACAPTTVSQPAPAQPAPQPTAPQVDLSGPVLVGLLAPVTASDPKAAELAGAIVNAARLALADAGNAGMRLEIYDTAGDPGRAAAAARQALSDGARLLVGPLFAQTTAAVGPVAAAANVNVLSFSTDAAVAGDPVYLSGYLPEAEADRMAAFAARRALMNVGIFYPQNAYGEAARRGMQRAAQKSGIRIVAEQSYPRSFQGIQQSAGGFVSEAEAGGAKAILLPDSGQGLRSVGAFVTYAGLPTSEVLYMGLGQWNSPITLEESTLQGGVFPSPDPERVQAFLSRYASQFGGRPPVLAALGYDAVAVAAQMLAEARAGGTDVFGDAQVTRAGGYAGALGPVRFFPDGTSERGMAILQVGSNGFDVIEPAPRSFGAGL